MASSFLIHNILSMFEQLFRVYVSENYLTVIDRKIGDYLQISTKPKVYFNRYLFMYPIRPIFDPLIHEWIDDMMYV